MCLDINCSAKVEENIGPLGAMFYCSSVLYCMSTSIANRSAALGTCGFSEPVVKALGAEAGFGLVDKVVLDNPFNNLYVLRA